MDPMMRISLDYLMTQESICGERAAEIGDDEDGHFWNLAACVATATAAICERLDRWIELQEERNALLREVNASTERANEERREFDAWMRSTAEDKLTEAVREALQEEDEP